MTPSLCCASWPEMSRSGASGWPRPPERRRSVRGGVAERQAALASSTCDDLQVFRLAVGAAVGRLLCAFQCCVNSACSAAWPASSRAAKAFCAGRSSRERDRPPPPGRRDIRRGSGGGQRQLGALARRCRTVASSPHLTAAPSAGGRRCCRALVLRDEAASSSPRHETRWPPNCFASAGPAAALSWATGRPKASSAACSRSSAGTRRPPR